VARYVEIASLDAWGWPTSEGGQPMTTDSIFSNHVEDEQFTGVGA